MYGQTQRFADLVSNLESPPVAISPRNADTKNVDTKVENATVSSFGPLPATMPADEYETLAPTTETSESPESLEESVSSKDTDEDEISYSPFGLKGLQKTFPMRGPDEVNLLSEKQALTQLKSMGLQKADMKPGMHLLGNGSAVVLNQERAFRVNHLDSTCVSALRNSNDQLLKKFVNASQSLRKSQEIANLLAVSTGASAISKSPVVNCPGSKILHDRMIFLQKNCDDWADARSKVAKLMHQRKSRTEEVEALKQKLSTVSDVLANDNQAVQEAAKEEKHIASLKKSIVLALTAELQLEVEGLLGLRKTVAKAYA